MHHRNIPGWELEVNGFNFMANLGLVLSLSEGYWFILPSTMMGVTSPRYAEALPKVREVLGPSQD